MSECDKLKLKKMYECDIGEYTKDGIECLDTCETEWGPWNLCTSTCKHYKMKGMCDQPFVQRNCKKTCNLCEVCRDEYGRNECKKLSYNGRCCEKEVMKNCMKTCNLCGII